MLTSLHYTCVYVHAYIHKYISRQVTALQVMLESQVNPKTTGAQQNKFPSVTPRFSLLRHLARTGRIMKIQCIVLACSCMIFSPV